MNVPDPLYTAWLEKADHDFLKGFLRFHDSRPPKIHDLSRLLDLCLAHDESLASLRPGCIELTDAGFQARYPDTSDDPTEEVATHAIEIAQRIAAAIRERVPKGNGS